MDDVVNLVLEWDPGHCWQLGIGQSEHGLSINEFGGREFFVTGVDSAILLAEALQSAIALAKTFANLIQAPNFYTTEAIQMIGNGWGGAVVVLPRRNRVGIELLSYEGSSGWMSLPLEQAVQFREKLLEVNEERYQLPTNDK